MNVQTKLNETISLSSTPFAKGGEGALYDVVSPANLRHLCAKIYHVDKRDEERAEKIEFLINNDPNDAYVKDALVWVKEILFDDGQFVGFLMPKIKGISLEVFCSSSIPKRFLTDWGYLSLSSSTAFSKRMEIATRLCLAIHQLHDSQQYLLIDIKPENILINEELDVFIVDLDSVEILKDGKTLFDAPVSTPQYTPPEHYQDQDDDPTETVYWDLFGLGVILYKLFFGIHPYTGTCKAPNDHYITISDKIKRQLLPMGGMKKEFEVIPAPHQRFDQLPNEIKGLFYQCFLQGGSAPKLRPTANEWIEVLWKYTYHPTLIERLLPHFFFVPVPSLIIPDFRKNRKELAKLDVKGLKEIEFLMSPIIDLPKLFKWRVWRYYFRLKYVLSLICIVLLSIGLYNTDSQSQLSEVTLTAYIILLTFMICWYLISLDTERLSRLNWRNKYSKLKAKAYAVRPYIRKHTRYVQSIAKIQRSIKKAAVLIKDYDHWMEQKRQELDELVLGELESTMDRYHLPYKASSTEFVHVDISLAFTSKIQDILHVSGLVPSQVAGFFVDFFTEVSRRNYNVDQFLKDDDKIALLNISIREKISKILLAYIEIVQFIESINRNELKSIILLFEKNDNLSHSFIQQIDNINMEIGKPINLISDKRVLVHLQRWKEERKEIDQEVLDLEAKIDAALKERKM